MQLELSFKWSLQREVQPAHPRLQILSGSGKILEKTLGQTGETKKIITVRKYNPRQLIIRHYMPRTKSVSIIWHLREQLYLIWYTRVTITRCSSDSVLMLKMKSIDYDCWYRLEEGKSLTYDVLISEQQLGSIITGVTVPGVGREGGS